jgi:hypothetical protein
MNATSLEDAVRDGILRGLGVVGLAGIALVHLLDAPGQFAETPYLGWLYVALILGCVVVGVELVRRGDPRAWAAAGALALSVAFGYVLSRTTGLPGDAGDVGNWGEQLGIASLFVEGALVTLSAFALRGVAQHAGPRLSAVEVAR